MKKITEEMVEKVARAMQGTNAILQLRDQPWESIEDKERGHWKTLAEAGLIALTN